MNRISLQLAACLVVSQVACFVLSSNTSNAQSNSATPTATTVSSRDTTTQSIDVAELLPRTTAVYIESVGSEHYLNSTLVRWLVETQLFKEIWRSPDVMKARGGITLAEVALGEKLVDALAKATRGGLVVAADTSTKGAVLLARAESPEVCGQLYKKLTGLAASDAKNKGLPFKQATYRDFEAYETGGAIVGSIRDLLVVTNKPELGKAIVDNYLDHPGQSLANQPGFKEAHGAHLDPSTTGSPTPGNSAAAADASQRRLAWAWLDLRQLESAGIAKRIFKGPDDNFVAQLLIGGAVACLQGSNSLTASLTASDDRLRLHVSIADPPAVTSERYQFFFGVKGSGRAPEAVQLGRPHASLTVYRDLAAMWRHAGDLFDQSTNDQLAQADTTLTTLFSGRDFGEDILAAIEPGLQVLVAEQTHGAGGTPVPQIKLPAFGLVTELKDPEKMHPQLKRIFMSLIGFLNVAGAMNQQPQLDLETVRKDAVTIVAASYAVEVDRPKNWQVPIQYNFSPTLVMSGRHAVLASTRQLAEELVDRMNETLKSQGASSDSFTPATQRLHPNTRLRLESKLVHDALAANRPQLISQNMVEKGHSREEAEREIDTLLKIIQLLRSFDLRLDVGSEAALDMQLQFQTSN